MLDPIIDNSKIKQLRELTDNAKSIVITCHLAPDGDALGSSLALMHVLLQFGKNVHVVTPDLPPATLMFIPGAKEIVAATRFEDFSRQLFKNADLIYCLDFNAPHRIGRLAEVLSEAKAPKILIDHHLYPSVDAKVVISHPEISSTCLLLFRVLCQAGWAQMINKKSASCIYTGMMTDTGNFSYNSLDPAIYEVIAELVRKGVDKDRLYKFAFNTKTETQLRLNGFAIAERMTLYPEYHAALIVLDKEDLKNFGYHPGDTEGLVNVPLSMPGINMVVYLREEKDYIKVSARSEGIIPVNELCSKYFNGGGHLNAAGGEFRGTLQTAIETFINALPDFSEYLKPVQSKNSLKI